MVKRKDVPDFYINFRMDKLQLTLVNDIERYSGVEFTMQDFCVNLKLFDAQNKYQRQKMNLTLTNRMFSMQVVKRDADKKIIYCPFVQQLIQPSA